MQADAVDPKVVLADIIPYKQEIRSGLLTTAVGSFRGMDEVLKELNETEILTLLNLEADTLRRPTVQERLVQRLGRLIEDRTRDSLTRRYYNATYPIVSND